MNTARFKVIFAGPLVSFQDAGRIGHLRFGVSASGPMDRFSHAAANVMLGNAATNTSIEVSLGGIILECISGETTLALAGGCFSLKCADHASKGWVARTVRHGEKIAIRAGAWGSWAYLAFAGRLVVNEWLGATATHSMSGFGGGSLIAGSEFEVIEAEVRDNRVGDYPCPNIACPSQDVRVVVGPQDQHFERLSVNTFCTQPFQITDAFDRMGVRLKGPKLVLKNALSIPSEPIVRGSVQVSGDGVPTVLLADHQTTGGYPKIATVVSGDVDRMVQFRAGEAIQFRALTAQKAIEAVREYHTLKKDALAQIIAPRATLAEKLQNLNLIDGVVSADPS
ncbi:MAG: biotin-dependent carboxyltransferase family protein [Amylibacter sp.]